MKKINQHITCFLDYYIKLTVSPEYAVLLSGKWGSGKTFFISDFIKHHLDKDIQFINISLFGIKHINEVKQQIFFQLIGVKKNKISALITTAYNGLQKIFGFKKIFSINVDDIPIEIIINFDKLRNKKIIFIFDDLERTEINIIEILGYINILIEKLGYKVITLANEEEFKDKDKDKYKKFKKKVIGKSFEVQQDFRTAFESFIELTKTSKTILPKHQSIIEKAFKTAGYNNLRSIRQTILDFEYFYRYYIDDNFRKNTEFIDDIIVIFFIISIEIKDNDLSGLKNYSLSSLLLNEKEDMTLFFEKYQNLINHNLILSSKQWLDFFNSGILNKNELFQTINNSKYFISITQADWIKLWHYYDLEGNDFLKILTIVVGKFNNNQYTNHQELLHVSGILLELSKLKLYHCDKQDIIRQAKCNISTWTDESQHHLDTSVSPIDSIISLAYRQEGKSEFSKIRQYADQKNNILQKLSLQDTRLKLIKAMTENDIDNCKDIIVNENNYLLFEDIDNVSNYLQAFTKMSNKNLLNIRISLLDRYDHPNFVEKSINELTFFEKLIELVDTEVKNKKMTIKSFHLKNLKTFCLEKIVEKLKSNENTNR